MTLNDWIQNTKQRYNEHGIRRATTRSAIEFLIGGGRRLGKRMNFGTPVWEREWEVLVILDACRYDLMAEIASEWDCLQSVSPTYSAASASYEWLQRHTQPRYADEMAETMLIAANAWTRDDCVRAEDWAALDEIWKHAWSDEEGTVLPRPVTDSAIHHWRRRTDDTERMIVWYLQPHSPFIDADWSDGFEGDQIGVDAGGSKNVWNHYRNGRVSRTEIWRAYRDNLEHVLEDVALLIDNLDADVAITADHANCLGEWGIYGHPPWVPAPVLKRVPWVEASATDEHTYDPEYEPPGRQTISDTRVDEQLAALGYT